MFAATFGWLCVETMQEFNQKHGAKLQLPSGGCVLKLNKNNDFLHCQKQLPSGGCVLKL